MEYREYRMTLGEWQKRIKNKRDMIVQASTVDGRDGLTEVSIGMCYHYGLIKDEYEKYQIGEHEKTVLCAISTNTDRRRRINSKINRMKIVETLRKNGIENRSINPKEYYGELVRYKYIISPEGNGIDCHRHYEAIMAGSIPIVEENEIIRKKYGDVPILYTRDYGEITEEYLERKYEEMKNREYDFSRLFMSNLDGKNVELIKMRGNYWMEQLMKMRYYE